MKHKKIIIIVLLLKILFLVVWKRWVVYDAKSRGHVVPAVSLYGVLYDR
jgi:hypothetical protein